MTELKNAKMYGGIGSILMIVGGVSSAFTVVSGIISIIGLIMVMIAIKQISDEVKDESVFKNYLMYFIISIIAVLAFIMILSVTIMQDLSFYTDIINQYQSGNITDPYQLFEKMAPLLTNCIIAFVVFWILISLGAIFLRRSFNSVAKYTNVNLFATTGLIYLIGAVTIIILIGSIILFLAQIIQAVAFFSLPNEIQPKVEQQSSKVEPISPS